jgi:lipopolysaccharide/colanic/teichoic acid biosynthesis glycosyltransferase
MVTENSSVQMMLAQQQAAEEILSPVAGEHVLTLYVPVRPMTESLAFRTVKRLIDVGIATTALLVLSPIMIALALLIKLQDGGPIFYKQARVGRYGVPFPFYKFRSMRTDADKVRKDLLTQSDAEGAAFKMKNDPRVTKLGRFMRKYSLDELPQLFSVLSGHMAIIGPRPHLPEEVNTYTFEQRARLLVKPGLICLREIKGRSHLSFEEWVALDLEYVNNRSIWYDTVIFLKAIPAVLRGEGAY